MNLLSKQRKVKLITIFLRRTKLVLYAMFVIGFFAVGTLKKKIGHP